MELMVSVFQHQAGQIPSSCTQAMASGAIHPFTGISSLPYTHALWIGGVSSLILGSHSCKHTIDLKCFLRTCVSLTVPSSPGGHVCVSVGELLFHLFDACRLHTVIVFRS